MKPLKSYHRVLNAHTCMHCIARSKTISLRASKVLLHHAMLCKHQSSLYGAKQHDQQGNRDTVKRIFSFHFETKRAKLWCRERGKNDARHDRSSIKGVRIQTIPKSDFFSQFRKFSFLNQPFAPFWNFNSSRIKRNNLCEARSIINSKSKNQNQIFKRIKKFGQIYYYA